MLTLSQLRRRVDALKRKYAKELAVVRLRRLADQYSQQWACDISDRKPAPQSQPFIRQIAQSGYRLKTFAALDIYLKHCRERGDIPDSLGVISRLLPKIPFDHLREMLLWDAPAPPQLPSRTSVWSYIRWRSQYPQFPSAGTQGGETSPQSL